MRNAEDLGSLVAACGPCDEWGQTVVCKRGAVVAVVALDVVAVAVAVVAVVVV